MVYRPDTDIGSGRVPIKIGAPNIEKSFFDVKPRAEVGRAYVLNAELEAEESRDSPFLYIAVEVSLEDHFKGNPRGTEILSCPRPYFA